MITKLIQLHFVTPIVPPAKAEGETFVTTQNIHAVTFSLSEETAGISAEYDAQFVTVAVERESGLIDSYSYPTSNIARIKITEV
jgi:hypothetical protein